VLECHALQVRSGRFDLTRSRLNLGRPARIGVNSGGQTRIGVHHALLDLTSMRIVGAFLCIEPLAFYGIERDVMVQNVVQIGGRRA
jgi:hypothetical protein